MSHYKKLIMNSGGIKGISFIGAISALVELEYLKNIETFIGVSAGSICCLGVILGYDIEQMKSVLSKINFIEDCDINILSIFKNYGINNCNSIMNIVKLLLKNKKIKEDLTLYDLFLLTGKEFIIVTTNLTKGHAEYLSYKITPGLKILDAIRMSINIPFYFEKFYHNGDIYIDGAISDNFPVNPVFPNGAKMLDALGEETIILKITDKSLLDYQKKHQISSLHNSEIGSFEDYSFCILKMVINTQDSLKADFYSDIKSKVINIDTSDFNSINFNINSQDKNNLFNLGYTSVKDYFSNISSSK